jgi:hypothetical protein
VRRGARGAVQPQQHRQHGKDQHGGHREAPAAGMAALLVRARQRAPLELAIAVGRCRGFRQFAQQPCETASLGI